MRWGSGRWDQTRERAALRLRELVMVPVEGAAGPPAAVAVTGEPAVGEGAGGAGDSCPEEMGTTAMSTAAMSSAAMSTAEMVAPAVRWRIDPRAVTVLVLVALGGVAIAGYVLVRSSAQVTEVVPARVVAAGDPIASPIVRPTPAATVLVDVQRRVRRPGVVSLPAGSRVLDALAAAGGPRRGVATTTLNLARTLVDGEQIVLDPDRAWPAAVPGAADSVVPVDLNLATVDQLDDLPGVGPVLAERIIAWRSEHGGFTAIEELQEVPGIGSATFDELSSRVTV